MDANPFFYSGGVDPALIPKHSFYLKITKRRSRFAVLSFYYNKSCERIRAGVDKKSDL